MCVLKGVGGIGCIFVHWMLYTNWKREMEMIFRALIYSSKRILLYLLSSVLRGYLRAVIFLLYRGA